MYFYLMLFLDDFDFIFFGYVIVGYSDYVYLVWCQTIIDMFFF